jgi:hypothetical protein
MLIYTGHLAIMFIRNDSRFVSWSFGSRRPSWTRALINSPYMPMSIVFQPVAVHTISRR